MNSGLADGPLQSAARKSRGAVKSPPTPKGQRTRDRILLNSRRVFGRNGYVAARMVDIAEESGLSLGGLYRYFTSKESLFRELVTEVHEALFDASSDHTAKDLTPYDALLASNRHYLECYRSNRAVLRAYVEASAVDDDFRAMWLAQRERYISRFIHAYAQRQGVAVDNDVRLRTFIESLACLVEHSAYVWFGQADAEPPLPIEQLAEVVTQIWYHAIELNPSH